MISDFKYPTEVLELNKILLMLAKKTSCEEAYKEALKIEPKENILEVNALLRETCAAYELQGRYGTPSFGGLYDIKQILNFARSGRILSTAELLKVASVLRVFSEVTNWKKQSQNSQTDIDYLFEGIYVNKFLQTKISTSIISEDEISDSASSELASIRRKIRAISSRVREKLDKIIRSPSNSKYLQEPIVTIRNDRFVIPVKSEYRSVFGGFVHDTSSSGSTAFIEPVAVLELNNEINVLKSKEQNEITRILKELSSMVADCFDMIFSSYKTAVKLNVVFAKSSLAYEMRAVVPIMNDEKRIDLKKARHPLIEPKKVVAIDVNLGIDFDTLIITGPNTGGKTVTLKTIGLLTLMAMCGLMIPASDGSELSVFKTIFCDIGDEQSIEQSLSTFSSHMTNIIRIQKQSDEDSLILLDELGAGTDPVEGAALAMAILEDFRSKKSKIVSTTHYAELKAFALNTERVENACCEFDVRTLQPTYKLIIGIPGKSNAFAICKKLSMPIDIIKRANELLSYENRTFESVIDNLEKTRRRLNKERYKAVKIAKDLKLKEQKAEETERKMQRAYEKSITEAKQQAQRIIANAEANAEELLEKLEKMKKKKYTDKDVSRLRKALNKAASQADPVIKKDNSGYVLPRKIKVGDEVLIVDLDREAEVLKLPDQNGDVLVQAGIIQTRVSIKNLRLLNKEKVSTPKGKLTSNVKKEAKTEIDLRGKTGYEAITELDKFIDEAAYSGINYITIIHGKGTGALRREVSVYLKRHKSIKSYRLGNFGEGDTGVTIAELK